MEDPTSSTGTEGVTLKNKHSAGPRDDHSLVIRDAQPPPPPTSSTAKESKMTWKGWRLVIVGLLMRSYSDWPWSRLWFVCVSG